MFLKRRKGRKRIHVIGLLKQIESNRLNKCVWDHVNEIEKNFPHRESNPDRQGESLLS